MPYSSTIYRDVPLSWLRRVVSCVWFGLPAIDAPNPGPLDSGTSLHSGNTPLIRLLRRGHASRVKSTNVRVCWQITHHHSGVLLSLNGGSEYICSATLEQGLGVVGDLFRSPDETRTVLLAGNEGLSWRRLAACAPVGFFLRGLLLS